MSYAPSYAPPQQVRGLARMLGAVVCFAVMAAFVKLGRARGMSTAETMLYRMAPGLLWVAWEIARSGAPFRPRRRAATWLRTAFGIAAMAGSFYAVSGLSLLQHTILHLTQPVFVAILAPLLLRERLSGRAVAALVLALSGALLAIQPDRAADELARTAWRFGLVGLAAAIASALAHLTVRLATGPMPAGRGPFLPLAAGRGPDAPETVVWHFTFWGSVCAAAYAAGAGEFHAFSGDGPHGPTLGIVAGMAAFGAAGQLLMSRAYAATPAPLVAIVAYAAIPLSILLDALVWRVTAAPTGLAGTALMVIAGLLLARARVA